jgi:hypothetical protein
LAAAAVVLGILELLDLEQVMDFLEDLVEVVVT